MPNKSQRRGLQPWDNRSWENQKYARPLGRPWAYGAGGKLGLRYWKCDQKVRVGRRRARQLVQLMRLSQRRTREELPPCLSSQGWHEPCLVPWAGGGQVVPKAGVAYSRGSVVKEWTLKSGKLTFSPSSAVIDERLSADGIHSLSLDFLTIKMKHLSQVPSNPVERVVKSTDSRIGQNWFHTIAMW